MPFIQANLSISMTEEEMDKLEEKLSDVVSEHFSKPKQYIMSEIEADKRLYMGGKKIEKGAYISISLLGSASKQACAEVTKAVCDILVSEYSLNGSNIYVTYHPESLWGWNGMMF